MFGNEGADLDIDRFSRRFGVPVIDSYGSTEGGAIVQRTPDMPPGALGRGADGMAVLDPETGEERPPARFDADGRLLNPDEAIGELVNRLGASGFEGYWNNDEANTARVHDGVYWTGDLAYRDEQGYLYFAGRDYDWLRVDGENFAAAPVERILARHPEVVLAAVYAVPDPDVGDQRDGRVAAPAGCDVRPGRLRFVPRRPARPRHEVDATVRAHRRDPPGHRDEQGPQAGAATRPVGDRRRRVVATGEGRGRTGRLTPADAEALRAEFAARGHERVLEAT